MGPHRELNDEEKAYFRKWARDNYTPYDAIDGTWHPIVQEECAKMNAETDAKTEPMVAIEHLFPAETAP